MDQSITGSDGIYPTLWRNNWIVVFSTLSLLSTLLSIKLLNKG